MKNEENRFCRSLLQFAVILPFLAGLIGQAIGEPIGIPMRIVVTRIDGTTVAGEWIASPTGDALEMRSEADSLCIPFEDMESVSFLSGNTLEQRESVIYLQDGGRLYGRLLTQEVDVKSGPANGIAAETLLGDNHLLPLKRLAGIKIRRDLALIQHEELFQEALRSRLAGQDVLITRSEDDVQSIRGILESMDANEGRMQFGDRTRTFRIERAFGVVFAAGAEEPRRFPVLFEAADSSIFSGRILQASSDSVRIETSVGNIVDLSLSRIQSIRPRSERVVFLSDLTALEEHSEGVLHRPWPIRRDRSVSNSVISLGGRVHEKGIGCHSRCEMSFDLNGEFERFLAIIGLDDHVRPRGSVVFRVSGDGNCLWESGSVTGYDAPRELNVEVLGIRRLTLQVEYGENLDLSDHADWANARLIRPKSPAFGRPSRTSQSLLQ